METIVGKPVGKGQLPYRLHYRRISGPVYILTESPTDVSISKFSIQIYRS